LLLLSQLFVHDATAFGVSKDCRIPCAIAFGI
jgi:hypothetical protein